MAAAFHPQPKGRTLRPPQAGCVSPSYCYCYHCSNQLYGHGVRPPPTTPLLTDSTVVCPLPRRASSIRASCFPLNTIGEGVLVVCSHPPQRLRANQWGVSFQSAPLGVGVGVEACWGSFNPLVSPYLHPHPYPPLKIFVILATLCVGV